LRTAVAMGDANAAHTVINTYVEGYRAPDQVAAAQ
jgi:hypothetical protein